MFRRILTTNILARRRIANDATEQITKDVCGPADPKSNLRLVTFYIPPNESEAEKDYRLQRAKVQEWNHEFWAAHNAQFTQAKEKYVTSFMAKKGNAEPLTADEMSEFYSAFLDDNWSKHFKYNNEWHKKNLMLLWPGVKANISKLRRQLFS